VSECEVPRTNADGREIDRILSESSTVAVIGLSPKEERPSHDIYRYLKAAGYRVFGVNPGHSEIAGDKVYRSLSDVPSEIDIVNIFRRPEHIPEIVREAIAKNAKTIWMQLGIVNNAAADEARKAGLSVVMNKCIRVEHARRHS
jgi:predicted CoA-binding protein